MGVPTSEVGYTSATTGRETMKSIRDMWWHWIRERRLQWFGHVQRMEENRIRKRVSYMNLESTRPGGRPRNRWQDQVRKDGRIVGGEDWQGKVYNREEQKKLLRMARNRHILHMANE
jgi:hypothetical protein